MIGVGTAVGFLTVEEATEQRKGGYIVWRCRCSCGGEILLDTRCLKRGTVKDCGCISRTRPGQHDITGERFGRLVAVSPTRERSARGSTIWLCRCDCGSVVKADLGQLTAGYKKSCGCLQAAIYKKNLKLVDGTSVVILRSVKSGRLLKSNTSGHNGVYYNKKNGRWVAQITFKGKKKYLGSFDNLTDAVKARQRAEEIYDEFLEQYNDEENKI